MSDPRAGVAKVLAEAAAEAPSVEPVEQLSLLEAPGPTAAQMVKVPGRAGRPKGAVNRKTKEMADYLGANWRDPLVTLAMLQAENPLVLAERLSCKPVEAVDRIIKAAAELAPYMHSKMPVEVDLGGGAVFNFVSPEAALAFYAARPEAGTLLDAPDFTVVEPVEGGENDA